MIVRTLHSPPDFLCYEAWLADHPQATLWQSLSWKRYQEAIGRETKMYIAEERGKIMASALVIIDRTVGGWSAWDVPRGPLTAISCQLSSVSNSLDILLPSIIHDARQERCMTVYLSPLYTLEAARLAKPFGRGSWALEASPRHEHPQATRIVDLTLNDDALLKQMHPKGRYNIHVAQKHGVQVKQSDDAEAFYHLLRETAKRDGFRLLPLQTYKAFLECLPGFLLLAYPPSPGLSPIAGLLGVMWSHTGIYYYGASSSIHRALMAPHLLQWEAMRHCRAAGACTYDLLGIEPARNTRAGSLSEGTCPLPRHPWEGISAFKAKFGGRIVAYPPEQQIVLRPLVQALLQVKRGIFG